MKGRRETDLCKEHVGGETTFWGVGIYESARCLFLTRKHQQSGPREVLDTLLCALLAFAFGLDFFWHCCGEDTTRISGALASDDDDD
jgi:hypothetical protein